MPAIIYKRQFFIGLVLLISFFMVLAVILSPVFNGKTGIQAADELFNSLSKNSSYYIPDVAKKATIFEGKKLDVTLKTKSSDELEKTKKLFEGAGAEVVVSDNKLKVRGDLGLIVKNALADADAVFKVQKGVVKGRYGFPGREAVYYWWSAFKQIEKDYTIKNMGKEALFVKKINSRALEPAYNYTGIIPAKFSEQTTITIGWLIFYFIYTIWFGFAILLLFEGLGITASKPAEKAEA